MSAHLVVSVMDERVYCAELPAYDTASLMGLFVRLLLISQSVWLHMCWSSVVAECLRLMPYRCAHAQLAPP